MKIQGNGPDEEYTEAESEFQQVDAELAARRKQVQDLRRANKKEEAEQLVADSAGLQEQWQAAKDRFDLAIHKRKATREKAAALKKKIAEDTSALNVLSGNTPDPPLQPPFAADQTAAASGDAGAVNPPAPAPAAASPTTPAPAVGVPPLLAPLAQADMLSGGPGLFGSRPPAVPNEQVALAQKEAKQRREAAKEAKSNADSVSRRFEGLRKNISLEQQLLDLSQSNAEQSQAARAKLDAELQRQLVENPAGLDEVWKKIAQADKRYADARAEVKMHQDRLDELRGELDALQAEQIGALQNAKQLQEEAEAADWRLGQLQNPFTPTNLLQWFLDHGPKLLTILAGTLFLSLLVKLSGRQIAQVVARTGSRGTAHDRQNRAVTLVGVFRNTASLVLVTGGTLMALDEVGIPIGPLMGGAAVLGLAVAFGAQNLIRDYFSGFMVLLEDQYGINDVVKIGDVSGSVEKITLRMTVLRDLEGAVHFIPHGSITRVTNMTHGWSRALVDIGVAYQEDVDRAIGVLMNLAKDLRKDPTYGPLILDGPEMLGVDSLGDSSVVIRFFVKTQPLQRWFVRRELLRRIKQHLRRAGNRDPISAAHHSPAQQQRRAGGRRQQRARRFGRRRLGASAPSGVETVRRHVGGQLDDERLVERFVCLGNFDQHRVDGRGDGNGLQCRRDGSKRSWRKIVLRSRGRRAGERLRLPSSPGPS